MACCVALGGGRWWGCGEGRVGGLGPEIVDSLTLPCQTWPKTPLDRMGLFIARSARTKSRRRFCEPGLPMRTVSEL